MVFRVYIDDKVRRKVSRDCPAITQVRYYYIHIYMCVYMEEKKSTRIVQVSEPPHMNQK